MPLARWPARWVQQRSLANVFHALSCAFARSLDKSSVDRWFRVSVGRGLVQWMRCEDAPARHQEVGWRAGLLSVISKSVPISLRGRRDGVKIGVGCPLTPTFAWLSRP